MKSRKRIRFTCGVGICFIAGLAIRFAFSQASVPTLVPLLIVAGLASLSAIALGTYLAERASTRCNIEEQIKKASLSGDSQTEDVRELVRLISDAISDLGRSWTEKTVLEIAEKNNLPSSNAADIPGADEDEGVRLYFDIFSVVIYPNGDVSAFAKK